ncbi:MAG: ribonuclease Z [Rikenellaceae bacterium]|nr:ribonuclease Z [Rikenellaceae bacterium]
MTFKVTILGSGSAMPTAGKHNSAHILNVYEQFYLIDCGEGTQIQMRKYGINPMKIRAVFISHLHGDHVYGLQGLISTMNFLKRATPLYVFGVRPLEDILDFHIQYFEPELNFEIIYKEINARSSEIIFENKVMEVYTIPLRHRVPSSGFLFKEKHPALNIKKNIPEKYDLTIPQMHALKQGGDIFLQGSEILKNTDATYYPYSPRSYAYCSDTSYSAKVADIVHGVDLLYHESTYLEVDRKLAKQSGHTTALQAAKIAEKADAGRLLLGHFSSRYEDLELFESEARTIFPNTSLAIEGETFEIPVKNYQQF